MLRNGCLLVAVALCAAVPTTGAAQAIRSGFNATSDGRNDDGTWTTGGCTNPNNGGSCAGTAVAIGFTGNFFGTSFNSLYLNTNGNATVGGPQSTYTPYGLTGYTGSPIFAPFFADVDTRNTASAVMQFGSGTVDGHNAFGVTWPGVGYFGSHADKLNYFQMILIDRSDIAAGDFDLEYNYDAMAWETGDASGGSGGLGGTCAAMGYSNGLTGVDNRSFDLTGSLTCGALIDGGPNALIAHSLNSNVLGRYDFFVRGGEVTTVPEPATNVLLATGMVVLGVAIRRRNA